MEGFISMGVGLVGFVNDREQHLVSLVSELLYSVFFFR